MGRFSFPDFACSSGVRQTGVKNSILISNFSRSLWIKTFTQRRTKEWEEALKKVVTGDPGVNPHPIEPFSIVLVTKLTRVKHRLTQKRLSSSEVVPRAILLCIDT